MVERSSVPRTLFPPPPPPPPPPASAFFTPPSNGALTFASAAATVGTGPVDTTATAQAIAEILAPSAYEIRAQLAAEAGERGSCTDGARVRAREVDAEVERRLEQDRRLDAAARRTVQERNRRDDQRARELRRLEDDARRRVEDGFRRSDAGVDGRGSRDRLVVVERESTSHRWCANCREAGHRAHDCRAVVVVNVAGDSERSYRPRGGFRHVRGV